MTEVDRRWRSKDEEFAQRTKLFALRIIRLYRALPKTTEAQIIGKQVIRSGTSVGANYREARRAHSKADFLNKLSICIKEADEILYWLELLQESEILKASLLTIFKTRPTRSSQS